MKGPQYEFPHSLLEAVNVIGHPAAPSSNKIGEQYKKKHFTSHEKGAAGELVEVEGLLVVTEAGEQVEGWTLDGDDLDTTTLVGDLATMKLPLHQLFADHCQ